MNTIIIVILLFFLIVQQLLRRQINLKNENEGISFNFLGFILVESDNNKFLRLAKIYNIVNFVWIVFVLIFILFNAIKWIEL